MTGEVGKEGSKVWKSGAAGIVKTDRLPKTARLPKTDRLLKTDCQRQTAKRRKLYRAKAARSLSGYTIDVG